MSEVVTIWECILRPLLAVGGGALLGWEREKHGKPAGLRTQMMVALGASAFTLITIQLCQASHEAGEFVRIDPSRVVQGIIGGIGFLGAGTIIQARGSVQGITTAATIWVVGALGVACGLGFYRVAAVTVVLAFMILTAIGHLEKRSFDGSESAEGDR